MKSFQEISGSTSSRSYRIRAVEAVGHPANARTRRKFVSRTSWLVYVLFLGAVAFACYRRPVTDDFDRYMYEAIVLGQHQSTAQVYERVKHESPRAEASSILDSPEHLAKLEPLYKIRPLYIFWIAAISTLGMSIQHAINLISAASLLGIGIVLGLWTRRLLLSALIVMSGLVAVLGRMGTPDALSTVVVLFGLLAIMRERIDLGCMLLVLSVWIRTDNVIAVGLALFILCGRRLPAWRLAAYCVAAAASVAVINRYAGNYGWTVLFQWSFMPGTHSPADIHTPVTIREYATVFASSFASLVGRLAIWMVLGLTAWSGSPASRRLLLVAALGVGAHFVLYPSPEDRYLVWGYLVVAIVFIEWVGQLSANQHVWAEQAEAA